jgi:hypothetical protein
MRGNIAGDELGFEENMRWESNEEKMMFKG